MERHWLVGEDAWPSSSAPRGPFAGTVPGNHTMNANATTTAATETPAAPETKTSERQKPITKSGRNLSELTETTGWQRHSARDFLSTARKRLGIKIEAARQDGITTYELV
jgi:hypothetical protein